MSIVKVCSCGKRLKVSDASAGKRVKCPGCGKSLAIDPPEPEDEPEEEEEEESRPQKKARDKKKKKKRRQEAGFLQTPLLGLRVGTWLIGLVIVAVLAGVGIPVAMKAIPALGKEPYYMVQDQNDHILVSIYNTPAGDFSVKVPKRNVKTQFDGGLGGIALPDYEWQDKNQGGKQTANGKTVRYDITCTRERGITEVRCDDKAVKLSNW